MRRPVLLAGGALLLVLIGQVAAAQTRDTVVVGLVGEPDNVLPGFSRLVVTEYVTSTLFVGLVDLNAEWRPFPRVAQEVPLESRVVV